MAGCGRENSECDVEIGVITGAFGINGDVKIRYFTDNPHDIGDFTGIYDNEGRAYTVTTVSSNQKKKQIIAHIKGVTSRESALRMVGKMLIVKRAMLPSTGDCEFYYIDLIGIEVRNAYDGAVMGYIKNVFFSGTVDVLEMLDVRTNKIVAYPFVKDFVKSVDTKGGYIVVHKIEEVE